jgi:hypothetical protein
MTEIDWIPKSTELFRLEWHNVRLVLKGWPDGMLSLFLSVEEKTVYDIPIDSSQAQQVADAIRAHQHECEHRRFESRKLDAQEALRRIGEIVRTAEIIDQVDFNE